MVKKLVIDAGHGGEDSGAIGNGLLEKNINLHLAQMMRDFLVSRYDGVEITMTRNDDSFPSLIARSYLANRIGADFFFATHTNDGRGTGYEDYTQPGTSQEAQKVIHSFVVPVLNKYGVKDRGMKQDDLSVLRETVMGAVLTECGFIDSDDANKYLKNESYLCDLAAAYADGVAAVMRLSKKVAPVAPVSPKGFVVGDYGKDVKVVADALNVRSGRGSNYSKLGQVYAGDTLNIWYIGKADDGSLWGSCRFNSKTGYVHMGYVMAK